MAAAIAPVVRTPPAHLNRGSNRPIEAANSQRPCTQRIHGSVPIRLKNVNRLRRGGELEEQGFNHDARRDEAIYQTDYALTARQRVSLRDFALGGFEQFRRGRVVGFEMFQLFEMTG